MSVQDIVEFTQTHSYTCGQCGWTFSEADGPVKGMFFEISDRGGWTDGDGDIFFKDSEKAIITGGAEYYVCHRAIDDSDYGFCLHQDLSSFTFPECHGWRCEGCGVEMMWDSEGCSAHTYGRDGQKAAREKVEEMCTCATSGTSPAAPAPEGVRATKDGFYVGQVVEVMTSKADATLWEKGDTFTITEVEVGGKKVYGNHEKRGGHWYIQTKHIRPHVELEPELADKFTKKEDTRKVIELNI